MAAYTKFGGISSGTGSGTSTLTSSSSCSSGLVSSACSSGGTSTTSGSAILCEAEQYQGIYYILGGGYSHNYASFTAECPSSVLSTAASSSTAATPGPCATDCSGLVSVAVDSAFNQTFSWDVAGIETDKVDWQKIPITSIKPGDVVTVGSNTHVEIVVDPYNTSTNTVTSFGSHAPGQQTGPDTSAASYWTGGAYRYIGPGSSS